MNKSYADALSPFAAIADHNPSMFLPFRHAKNNPVLSPVPAARMTVRGGEVRGHEESWRDRGELGPPVVCALPGTCFRSPPVPALTTLGPRGPPYLDSLISLTPVTFLLPPSRQSCSQFEFFTPRSSHSTPPPRPAPS
jgi:hypothetical protein